MLRIAIPDRLAHLTPATVAWLLPPLGLLPALAHPPLEWSPLAWLALAPPIWLLARGPGGVALWFGAGWGYGLVQAAFQFGWLPEALWVKGGLTWPVFLAFTPAVLAAAALAPAALFALCRWAWLRRGLSPCASFPLLYAAEDALLGVMPFGGVPWGSLAATQTGTWSAAVLVPALGASGLALALAAAGAGWSAALERWHAAATAKTAPGGRWTMLSIMAALTLLCAWPLAPAPADDSAPGTPAFKALIVPGDLSLEALARPSAAQAALRHFAARTLAALAAGPGAGPSPASGGPRLAVWPESAVPGEVEQGKLLADLHELAAALDTDFLLGSNARERGRIHNSAFLVTGTRFATVRYDKRRLVPFGEYVPLGFRALFGKKLSAGVQDYSPGAGAPVLDWNGTRLGLAICFESILPAHAREAARAGAEALVALSNDAWLTPAASRQHLQLSALRGLETGRDVLLAANGGWSALVRDGRLVRALTPGAAPAEVTVWRRGSLTPWVRWGYWPLLGVAGAWLALIAAWRRRGRWW